MRRIGYTNTFAAPTTFVDSVAVGATTLNRYLRDNLLAVDNNATPARQDIIHYSVPGVTAVNNTRVLIGAPTTNANVLALSQYSPNLALSIDASFRITNFTASAVNVEALVAFEDWEDPSNITWTQFYKYQLYLAPASTGNVSYSDPLLETTPLISSPNLGVTNYAVWSGFVNRDTRGLSPFSLAKPTYAMRTMLAISATNGSVGIANLYWAVRMRANVLASDEVSASGASGGSAVYGEEAF